MKSGDEASPSIGGFLYSTLAALVLGLLVNAVRGVVVDKLLYSSWFHRTIVQRLDDRAAPLHRTTLDYSKLKTPETLAAYQGLVDNIYRYYQYYANSLVAVVVAFAYYFLNGHQRPNWWWVAIAGIVAVLLCVARNELKSFNDRATNIMS